MIILSSLFSLLAVRVFFNCVPVAMILSSGPQRINMLAFNRPFISNSSITSQQRTATRCPAPTMFWQKKKFRGLKRGNDNALKTSGKWTVRNTEAG